MDSRNKDNEQLKQEILDAINDHNCFFFTDVFGYVTFTRRTAYNRGLNKDTDILDALELNKRKTLHSMRAKWYRSNNPLLQIALAKWLATDEEYHRIASTKQQVETTHIEQPLFKLNEDNDSGSETS